MRILAFLKNIYIKKEKIMEEKNQVASLSMLCDMENNNYLMGKAYDALYDRIKNLGKPVTYAHPTKEKVKKVKRDHNDTSSLVVGICAISLAVVGLIIFFTVFLPMFVKEGSLGVIGIIIVSIICGAIFAGIAALVGALLGFIIYPIVMIFLAVSDHKKNRQEKARVEALYKQAYENYKRAQEEDDARVKRELLLKKELEEERYKLGCQKFASERQLSRFYDLVGINPQFRNIVAISYMEQFVKLKISTKLDGTDGLYYLVMQELDKLKLWGMLGSINDKLDRIISSLNTMSGKLDFLNDRLQDISNNSYRLVRETEKNNDLLQGIHTTTALSLYQQERIAKEKEYQSKLITWATLESR